MLGTKTRIALQASVEPQEWPADALADVTIRLRLSNEGKRDATIYPLAAKLAEVASMAGVGVEWQLRFRGNAGPVHQQELRQWHGPPGNPPSPKAVKDYAEVVLAPGKAHETVLPACWIPNARLSPAHLDPATLDPTGMDNIAEHEIQKQWPSHAKSFPPLSRRIPLHQTSVLVLGGVKAQLAEAMAARPDFLRAGFSTVVAFFVSSGEHALEAAYLQHSWMDLGDKIAVEAPGVPIRVG